MCNGSLLHYVKFHKIMRIGGPVNSSKKVRFCMEKMSGKLKFIIPSAEDLNKEDNSVKPMTLFENYKKQKVTPVEKNQEPIQNTGSRIPAVIPPSNSGMIQATSVGETSARPASNNTAPKPSISRLEEPSDTPTETKVQPTKAASSNSIIVNFRQRGNPILKHIRNVPWEYNSIVPDYVMGKATCALYLSLRYHQLNPSYIHNRLKELGKGYDLRVLLAQVDVKDPHHLLKDLAKICILADLSLILAFSPEEAGRYLETYKVYENKPPDVLMEKTDKDYVSKLTDALTSVKSVNKTDSMTLLFTFKTTQGIINASKEDLSLCAGFGPQKAQRLYDVFHEPFLKSRKRLADLTTENDGDAKQMK